MLVKIGNIKIGEKRKGKPIVREGLLVTQAVKDNEEEFFLPFPGFTRSGEESLEITLPFDNPDLNFEVGYVSFGNVRFFTEEYIKLRKTNPEEAEKMEEEKKYEKIVPYMIREINDKGTKLIIGVPLSEYAPDVQAPFLYFSKSSEEMKKELKMELTGILKVMIHGVSGWGEVFHFKTKGKITINAIKHQLQTIDKITKGKTAGLVLKMKAFRKQFKDRVFPFVDISLPATDMTKLKDITSAHLAARKDEILDIKELEREYADRYPSLTEFFKGYKTKFDIEFEENEDVIHEIEDEESEEIGTSKEDIEKIVALLSEKFNLKVTQKNVLESLVKKVRNFFESEEEQIEEIEKRLNEVIEKNGKVLSKDILQITKDYTK